MTASLLDPQTALIVIDLQNGITRLPCAHPMASVVERAVTLLDAFRAHGLPVVLVNVAGAAPGRTEQPRPSAPLPADWADLIPEVKQQAGDILITKLTWGAFSNPDLEKQLRARGVTQVVIAGVATSIGVESTARQASERGFNVTLAIDAMTDMSAEAHENSIRRIFPRLGETASTEAIVGLLPPLVA